MTGSRRLRLLLFLALLVMLALPASLARCSPALAFSDVGSTHPYAVAIARLAERGIVSGRVDGTFGPDEPVSRCQFAKMIVNTLVVDHTDPSLPFLDVGPEDLPEFVAAAARAGITNGTNPTGTHFSPWAQVTRAQALTMVVRGTRSRYPGLLGYVFGGGYFGGWGPFDPVHAEPAATAWGNGLLDGLPPMETLDPWAPMPRGEVAQVLWDCLDPIDRAVRVTEVVDGDTLRADFRGTNETITLLGIDAPELDQPLGLRARDRLTYLAGSGTQTYRRLQFDTVTRDEKSDLLAYILFDAYPGWDMANVALLREGLARLSPEAPTLRYAAELTEAEEAAKEQRLGPWSANPASPLEIFSVHPNAAGGSEDPDDEWVEFRVTSWGTLAGYAVQNEAGQRYDFPGDQTYWGGFVFKLFSGAGTNEFDLYWGAEGEIWDDETDTVFVLDPAGRVVEEFSW